MTGARALRWLRVEATRLRTVLDDVPLYLAYLIRQLIVCTQLARLAINLQDITQNLREGAKSELPLCQTAQSTLTILFSELHAHYHSGGSLTCCTRSGLKH